MTTNITHTTGTITPAAVEAFRSSRPANTVVHDVLDRQAPLYDLRPFGLRSGSFRLVFDGQAAALNAEAALSVAQTLTISNTDVPALNMTFVVPEGADLDVEQDGDTTTLWRIIVPFREVAP